MAMTYNSRKSETSGPKWKQHSVVDVSDGERNVQCCKEQYCITTWNVRSMNQDGLDLITKERTRVNINILGISELKWTGLGEFKSDDHYIISCGQESLRRNGVALIVNKSPKCSTWVQSQKWQNDLDWLPRQNIQHYSNQSLCPNHWCWRSWSWLVLWRITRHSKLIPKKKKKNVFSSFN